MALQLRKRWGRLKRKLLGSERGHVPVLSEAVSGVLANVRRPVLLETGSIRSLDEGTESTLTIARLVQDRGAFYSFELRPEHIAVSRELCGEFDRFVTYVEGDSVANLQRLVADGTLARVDFAFLDSANDGDHTFRALQAIENALMPGSVLVCDDVLWADKGRVLVPYIEQSPDWESRIHRVENGMMVARRL
ncbi:MAG: class I SAM-dependent methyltransferase [Gammaproteobacteria bacterium]